MPSPRMFGDSIHSFFAVSSVGAIGDTSGVSFASPVGSGGALLTLFVPDVSSPTAGGIHQSVTPILDENLNVVVPTILSAPSPVVDTIITTGRSNAGFVAMEPDYLFGAVADILLFGEGIFIPPGNVLTFINAVLNTGFFASFRLTTYFAPPT